MRANALKKFDSAFSYLDAGDFLSAVGEFLEKTLAKDIIFKLADLADYRRLTKGNTFFSSENSHGFFSGSGLGKKANIFFC